MGHYSLWPVFVTLDWTLRSASNRRPSHLCTIPTGNVRIKNDYSFPAACTVRMPVRAKGASAGPRPLLV